MAEAKRTSILALYDCETGETTELARFPERIEAPFFRTQTELFYNARGRIFCLHTDSGEVEEIPTGECTRCNNDHVFSDDRRRLAVSHSAEGWGSRVYIVELGSDRPARLVTPLAPSYLHGWRGDTLLCCSQRNGEYDVYAVSESDGTETRLTFSPGLNDGPEFSPDGLTIWFCSVRSGNMECWRMDADGGNPVRLTDNGRHNWFPHISPDGTRAAYISYRTDEARPDEHPADRHVQLRLMKPDGSGDRCLAEFFGGQGSLNVNSWSPDSRFIAFVRYEVGK